MAQKLLASPLPSSPAEAAASVLGVGLHQDPVALTKIRRKLGALGRAITYEPVGLLAYRRDLVAEPVPDGPGLLDFGRTVAGALRRVLDRADALGMVERQLANCMRRSCAAPASRSRSQGPTS